MIGSRSQGVKTVDVVLFQVVHLCRQQLVIRMCRNATIGVAFHSIAHYKVFTYSIYHIYFTSYQQYPMVLIAIDGYQEA